MSKRKNAMLMDTFGRYILIISKRKKSLRTLFIKAGFSDIPYSFLSIGFILTLILTLLWYFYLVFTSGVLDFGILFVLLTSVFFIALFEIVILFIAIIILRVYLEVKCYNRVRDIEENLPLFLRELSTNLKAGREFIDALEDSLTPQIGCLNDDIKTIIVDIRSGKMTEQVIKDYAVKYDSYAINETFEIILDAYVGGGGLSEIIDRIAENLEVIHYLRKNAIASVSSYVIFTSIVSLLIAPILFALSYNLLDLIRDLLEKIVVSGSSSFGPLGNISGRLNISFSDFRLFSMASIAVIAGSAAAIIGIIRKGSLKGSPVLILVYIALSVIIYQISFFLLKYAFGILFMIK